MRASRWSVILVALAIANPVMAVMWFPIVNDELAIISLNQESVSPKGSTVAAEVQYVFQKTETLPYADDNRADTFKRMKTWLEFDCRAGTVTVLERKLIGERGDTWRRSARVIARARPWGSKGQSRRDHA
ncbi:MAG: hypothetical protein EBQ53_04545 [Betaproteobacteria bacterium]|nr:hypothetical protein [Betaproteobacteria bacterium]